MNNRKLIIAIIVIVIALGIIFFGHKRSADVAPENETATSTDTPKGKVAASSIEDGDYYVYVEDIHQNPEDTTLTLSHITYFEGQEARDTVENQVDCGFDTIDECAPTLKDGYYVAESGAPVFTAPVTASTKVMLIGKTSTDMNAFISHVRSATHKQVYVVTLTNGQITTINEIRN